MSKSSAESALPDDLIEQALAVIRPIDCPTSRPSRGISPGCDRSRR